MYKPLLFLFLMMVTVGCSVKAQDISIMTYNIRLDVASDGENAWPERKDILVGQVQFLAPDIFGIQEGMPHQTEYLNSTLESYDYIGHGRDGGKNGEYSAIFYNTDKFSVEQQNTFWLSKTPDTLSKGWDAAYPRICTYGLFTSKKSGDQVWVFNTHLDHKGSDARKEGLSLIRDKIKIVNTDNLPVVLMGDFNTEPMHEIIKEMEQTMLDTKKLAQNSYGSDGTFNGFKTDEIAERRIDYIFISKAAGYIVRKYAVLSNLQNLKYPSDHFPVYIILKKE